MKNNENSTTPKPFGRFVTEPAHMLLAMGVVPTEADLLLLQAYQTWPGFPKAGKQGYSAHALFQWAAKNAETIAYRKKVGKMIQQGADNSAADFKIVDQHASKATFSSGGNEYPETIGGLDRLGAMIQRRFPSLTVEVSRQLITKWKKLQCVKQQPGLVPFPSPTSANRYNVKEVFEWVERWIVSVIPDGGSGAFGAGADLERELKEINLRRAKRMEQRELGEIIPFADAEAYIAGLSEQIGRYYDRLLEGERGIRAAVQEGLKAAGVVDEVTLAVVDKHVLAKIESSYDDAKSEFDQAKSYALQELEAVRKESKAV